MFSFNILIRFFLIIFCSAAFNDSYPSSSSDNFVNQTKKTMLKPIPKIRTKEIRKEFVEVPISPMPPAPPSKYTVSIFNKIKG